MAHFKKVVIQDVLDEERDYRKLRKLLKLSPEITEDNLCQVDSKTWILKKDGMTRGEAIERFKEKIFNNRIYYEITHLYD